MTKYIAKTFNVKEVEYQNCDDIMDMCGVSDIYYLVYTNDGKFKNKQYSRFVVGPGIEVTQVDDSTIKLSSPNQYCSIEYDGKKFILNYSDNVS